MEKNVPEPSLQISDRLRELSRCPHCGVANPEMHQLWKSKCLIVAQTGGYGRNWATFQCTTCAGVVLAKSKPGNDKTLEIEAVYPEVPTVAEELPERARVYLEQAVESVHAPDGAAMLAGSAVDAMLKDKGLTEGSVNSRICQAVEKSILTQEMVDWADEVRLGSNRPRHADADDPHVTQEEAENSVEFAQTLGLVLYVLPARIARGRRVPAPEEAE